MNVVMVHGFADTGRLFRALSRSLASRGHACHTPTLNPRDAREGIADLSGKLEAFIQATLAPGEAAALVGFSMGALVARHYLQSTGGSRASRAFFSIAGPHLGTYSAYAYPGAGTREMRPGSAFLGELNARAGALGRIPVFTYRTPFDLMVNPARTTRLPEATELVVWCPLHSMLPSDPRVMRHIGDELAKLAPDAVPLIPPLPRGRGHGPLRPPDTPCQAAAGGGRRVEVATTQGTIRREPGSAHRL